jgi:hypothetical protein
MMDAAVGPEDTEGYLTILEAVRIAGDKGVKYGKRSIQQDISRGVIRGTRIGARLYVWEEDFKEYLELKV